MTELAVREDNTTSVVAVPSVIRQTATDLAAAHQIASAICATQFVPQHFRGKSDECAVAILYGQTIDLDPLTAVQQIYVIGGKPALYARAMVAIVLSHGHNIWTEDESEGSVTVAGQRKGSPRVERVTWTTEMARRAGYTSNKKYQTDPRSMLYARASGDIARRIAPDALLGMAYNVEELDLDPLAAPTAPVTAAAFTPAQSVDVGETPAQPVETTPAPVEMISPVQLREIGAAMRDLGITERVAQLAFVADAIGREITSRNDLTKDEASAVIDALEQHLAVPAEPVPEPVETEPETLDDASWGAATPDQA